MSLLTKIFGVPNEKFVKKLQPLAEKINNLEEEFKGFSLVELKNKTNELKETIKRGESLDVILPSAFALVREAARRTLNQRHFDVQLIGGIVLHQGKIAEMQTGEGKTLAATLPAYLNGLTGRGVHIVTVNDYLAKRDAVWMGQIYHALGLSVGCVVHDAAFVYDPAYMNDGISNFQFFPLRGIPHSGTISKQIPNSTPKESRLRRDPTGQEFQIPNGERDKERDKTRDESGGFKVVESYLRPVPRKEAYLADITYGTNNEFGFDYLRDNMVFDLKDKVQRDFSFAIVDEVDSILIDEARTPLIIAQPDFESSDLYKEFSRIIPRLTQDLDYNTDEKLKVASLTEQGIEKIERLLNVGNIYDVKGMKYLHYLEQALRAKVFFEKDRDYIVKQGEVIIIDEFTGRLMPGRRYSGGLHQAIEAKEGVTVQPESKILATITFQNYFRLYKKLAGMTGTALTSAEEFDKVYGLYVVVIPTNKPLIRKSASDLVYKTEAGKLSAIVKEIKERHEKGQPLLIGTRSVEKNEYLSRLLSREGIPYEVLNAKNHSREGEIIAQAGKLGAVTVATNMAGRGVDIILGGNPPGPGEAQKVKELGGLHVIGTERHEARRIDNQLRGRSGRQGDPGSSRFFISLEDELLRIFGGDRIKNLMTILKVPEDQPIEAKIISSVIEKAQTRVEGMHFDARTHVLEFDEVMSKHRNKIYSQRNEILGKDYGQLKEFMLNVFTNEIEKLVLSHYDQERLDEKEVFEELRTIFPVPEEVKAKIGELKEPEKVMEFLNHLAENLLEQKEEREGREALEKIFKFSCLKSLDMYWTDHLVHMEHLKDSVNLRAYGGKDPLTEYKTEGHRTFQGLWGAISSQIARTVFKLSITS